MFIEPTNDTEEAALQHAAWRDGQRLAAQEAEEDKRGGKLYSVYITKRSLKSMVPYTSFAPGLDYFGVTSLVPVAPSGGRYRPGTEEGDNLRTILDGLSKDQARGAEEALILLNTPGADLDAVLKGGSEFGVVYRSPVIDNFQHSTSPARYATYIARLKAGVAVLDNKRRGWRTEFNFLNPQSP
jgi:hypothetical protein